MSLRLVFKSIWKNPGNRSRRLQKSVAALGWQVRKRTLATPKVVRLANGAKFKLYPDCVVSSSLVYADWPEFHELQFLRRVLRPGDAVIDVGANVGHVSLLLSDIVGPEGIFAFEPTPVSYKRLVENWSLNRWATTQLFQCAVGSGPGRVRIPDTVNPETINSLNAVSGSGSVEVELVALDDLRARWREQRIGLLKIDVEGYEQEVLAGAQTLLREDRPRLVMFESLGETVEEKISAIFDAAHFKVFQLDEEGNADFSRRSAQNLFAVPEEEASLLA